MAPVAWVAATFAPPMPMLALPLAFQLFPDGRPVSRRWGLVWRAVAVWTIALVAFTAVSREGINADTTVPPNPFALAGPLGDAAFAAQNVLWGLAPLVAIATVASLLVRFRRSRGLERTQLKWIFYPVSVLAGVIVLAVLTNFLMGVSSRQDLDPIVAVLGNLGILIPLLGCEVALGVAILRYRLYDIDVLINRTIVYAALTAVLGATYVAAVIAVQAVLGPLTGGNEIAVAASTLLVVALFQPLRRRIQSAVDRRFYRSRYDASRTLDAFAARLRDEVDLDMLRGDLLGVVGEALRPASASVWLRRGGRP